jgi:hypothetical protein
MWKAAMDFVSGIFKPAADLIDNVHTSEEEKLELKNVLVKLQNEVTTKQIDLLSKQMDLEKQLLESQASIINTEAKSESWLARSWRPITMLTFVVIIVLHSLGVIKLGDEFALEFMALVKIGLGGYVVGRSAEKIAPAIAAVIGKK